LSNKRDAFIGIDVGKSGAISILIEEEQGVNVKSFATPTLPDGDIDVQEFFRILDSFKSEYNIKQVGIEKVHAIFKVAAGSTFEFGRSFGIAEGIVCAAHLPYTLVPPKKWQKEMWQGVDKVLKKNSTSTDTKAMSLVSVKRLYPNAELRDNPTPRSTKAHDGIVDAILIAEYCRRTYAGTRKAG
jgi:hypothetical protein